MTFAVSIAAFARAILTAPTINEPDEFGPEPNVEQRMREAEE
jgi:hypothetical protein